MKKEEVVNMAVKQLRGFNLAENNTSRSISNDELFTQYSNELNEDRKREIEGEIVKANIGIIRHIIRKRFHNRTDLFENDQRITYDDLFSIGSFALIKGIRTFDTTKKIQFATYSSRIIYNELGMFIRKNRKNGQNQSMCAVLNTDVDGNEQTLEDLLQIKESGIEDIGKDEFNAHLLDELRKSLKGRQKQVFDIYITNGDLNQRDIGEILGISQSYVSRVIVKIIKKGKDKLKRLERE
jgi:RNA polymerase sporulation-specific sigma factor